MTATRRARTSSATFAARPRSARERVKLLKLVWDFVGTEFGGRQLQYEMFYSAAQPVVNTRMFRSYDWAAARAVGGPLPGGVLTGPLRSGYLTAP